MSKILYVCNRNQSFNSKTKEKLNSICNELVPDNIHNHPVHKISVQKDIAYAVSMKNDALHELETNVLLGYIYGNKAVNWACPQNNYPDGNYALFRGNENIVEVVSDVVGTKTIWYYHDDNIFVASTSQRAIIMYLGSFSFQKKVIPWVLSTGSLGPELSWDKRLKRIPPDASLILDKKSWSISINKNPATFSEIIRHKDKHEELLKSKITQTVKSIQPINFEKWLLPLSGGYDSRAILCFFKANVEEYYNIKTVTWGLEHSLVENGNDAKIAKELAKSFGVKHKYYHTDISSESVEKVIDRFIFCSEGRIDHIEGYMDGMKMWKQFYDENITGVIRGDEGFGWEKVSSELTVRLSLGCGLCSDFKNLSYLMDKFKLPSQNFPLELKKKDNESLDSWRDRLYHEYRLPTILAALSDIKFSYVELINPLLSKNILHTVRTIPDNLRTEKKLYKNIVNKIGPNIPFASKGANASSKKILSSKAFVSLLKSEISSKYSINLFGEKLTKQIYDSIKESDIKKKKNIKEIISSLLPKLIKNALRDSVAKPNINNNKIAFRFFIIIRMNKMLQDDSARF